MTNRPLVIAVSVLVCLFSVLYAQTERPQPTEDVYIKTFYLKDGSVVMGRVVLEDRNQITLEETGHYLVTYTLGTDGATDRSTVSTNLALNGTQVESSFDYSYKARFQLKYHFRKYY